MTTTIRQMSAEEIIAALARKHSKDLFVPACKDGPTLRDYQQMDAWVMARSWAHPQYTAYEVKVHRGDFLRDRKWTGYLLNCNEFYFACPWKLIAPEEVPESAGLVWVTPNGGRVVTKRKAVWRDIPFPESVARYVLICRCRRPESRTLESDEGLHKMERQWWTEFIAEEKSDREIGWRASEKLMKRLDAARDEADTAKSAMRKYEELRAGLIAHGYDPDHPPSWNYGRDALCQRLEPNLTHLRGTLVRAGNEICYLREALRPFEPSEATTADESGSEEAGTL